MVTLPMTSSDPNPKLYILRCVSYLRGEWTQRLQI